MIENYTHVLTSSLYLVGHCLANHSFIGKIAGCEMGVGDHRVR